MQSDIWDPKETHNRSESFDQNKDFCVDVLYGPLTRGIIQRICAADTPEVPREASSQDKIRRKRKNCIRYRDKPELKKRASCSLDTVTETRKSRNSSSTGKRQKKLRSWIPIEALPVLLNSVMESIPQEERAVYDHNKIQDFLLKTVSEFGLGNSSIVSSQLFDTCRQYLLSHILGNPAFHSSFRLDFRSPVSIRSYKHFLINTSNTKDFTSWNIEGYHCNQETEERITDSASEQDVLNLHLGPRRLTRTLYNVLRSKNDGRNERVKETSRKASSCRNESFSIAKLDNEVEEKEDEQDLGISIQEDRESAFSSLGQPKECRHISHPIVRFLPILHSFFQYDSKDQSHHSSDKQFASVYSKACLLEVLNKLLEKDAVVPRETLMNFDNRKRIERNILEPQWNLKTQKGHYESQKSNLTCPYELARKDRILRNEEILRRMTRDKLSQESIKWSEIQEYGEFSEYSGKVPSVLLVNEEMEKLRKFLQGWGIFCELPLWNMLTAFIHLLVEERDQKTSHSPSFYATSRDIRRMERVLESCSENGQVHEAVRRYIRILQSTEYRERRNLFTLFRGPWNDENKNAIFFQAWEKYGNGRDANKLIAMEMGSDVHPNQVAYMKSLYPGWLLYKQMLSGTCVGTQGQENPNSSDYQPICAFCLAPNNDFEDLQSVANSASNSREEDLDLGPFIGPLRFAAFNSVISSSCSSFSSNSGYFVHRLCALWAPEVFEAYDGTLLNIAQAIQRARQIFCCYCRRKGASLGCKECKRCYHAPKCALLAGCYLDTTTFQLLCPLHARVEAAVAKNSTQHFST
ncbi:ubiquitin-protein ligase [Galdieria sulphuraria]|uniref:Ubiquitin-protein ligase n=1 Tax=Galdieria sulphuraria TaxID=130081 RepID=M2Y8P0_GALSU|nr:ubiquitin-protein ligase [Galdieria sulphuraria]EME32428.1 ubiquitin-protein ligase [Galdieria sulphuraria]|eukprot:XP_005708948.1 ubiquitin-protein ligase [Galdieria sulphuraria]